MLNMKKPIRWGIIGCGDVTEVKSGPPYQYTPDFELSAVMRRNHEKALDYAKRHGVQKVYSTAEELIADGSIDAVYIATPPDTHKLYGLKVAEAGKPCCIEKPMSPSYADSLEIYNAFKDKNVPLFIAYYRRSLPRFLKVKEWLDTNKIGQIRHVRWHLSKPASDFDKSGEYNWRTDFEVAPGGYFDDVGSHGLDLFAYLFGDYKSVHGIAKNQQGLYTSMDAITGCWEHESGVIGEGSWIFGGFQREDKVEIIGSLGKIVFSVFEEVNLELHTNEGVESLFIENPKNVQKYHVANIKKHLLEEGKHPSLGSSGLHTSWAMDKILGSI